VLLKESIDRRKSSRQIISCVLFPQFLYIREPQYSRLLDESQQCLGSWALVHERVCQPEELTGIYLKRPGKNLIQALLHFYRIKAHLFRSKIHQDILTVSAEAFGLPVSGDIEKTDSMGSCISSTCLQIASMVELNRRERKRCHITFPKG
jgi:two-component sensor histidine kinase